MEQSGDAILIDLGETEILIDAGVQNSGVAAYIEKYVDGPLDTMVITHPHGDHMGGAIAVLEKYEIKRICLNGDRPLADDLYFNAYKKFENMINTEGAAIHIAQRGQMMDIGALSFFILHPDIVVPCEEGSSFIDRAFTTNKNSMAMRLKHGEISFLFAGDIPKEIEQDILKAGLEVQADILKVAHHASGSASSSDFLKQIKPKVAVYMSGVKPPTFGPKKPDPTTIATLKESGAKVYGNKLGNIIISTDGKTFSVGTVE
jgi:competence protein ComEC